VTPDGLDVGSGFLSDKAGNASEAQARANIEVTMGDVDAPRITAITAIPSSEAPVLKIGDQIVFSATLDEAVSVESGLTITLSNNKSVNFLRSETSETTMLATYTISEGEDAEITDETPSGLSILRYLVSQDSVDTHGNLIFQTTSIDTIDQIGSIAIDATNPVLDLGIYQSSSNQIRLIFSEELSDTCIDDIETALRALSQVAPNAEITASTNSGGGSVLVMETVSDFVDSGDGTSTLGSELTLVDLAGNSSTYLTVDLTIF